MNLDKCIKKMIVVNFRALECTRIGLQSYVNLLTVRILGKITRPNFQGFLISV